MHSRAAYKQESHKMGSSIIISVQRLAHGADLNLPRYETERAVGMDLCAAVSGTEPIILTPSSRVLVPTGLIIALPFGFEAQIRPRSGLAVKHGITVLNSPGTIDCDYRGEIRIILINHGQETFIVKRGMRIAQIVISEITYATFIEVAQLHATVRNTDGFGSTGM